MSNKNHVWGGTDLSTCELCGDKDWMADDECSKRKEIKMKSGSKIKFNESKTPLTGEQGWYSDE